MAPKVLVSDPAARQGNKTTMSLLTILHQAHENNNAMVKGDGGAVGQAENPGPLRRWMVSGPEISRMINEFELSVDLKKKGEHSRMKHHGVQKSVLEAFFKQTKALVAAIEEMSNPFMEDSNQLSANVFKNCRIERLD